MPGPPTTAALAASVPEDLVIKATERPLLPPLDAARLERLEAYLAAFRSVFRRADQFLRFRAYLHGLLAPTERKNVEAIAAAAGEVLPTPVDLAQALQHFVSHSPWEAHRLLAAFRCRMAAARADPQAVWVVHEGVFPKKGKHSVGVQRQFARSLGIKINCQLGVFVSQVGPSGYLPLAARLYLPPTWLREQREAARRAVPQAARTPASKVEIALSLLDELRADGETPRGVAGEPSYLSDDGFTRTVLARGLSLRSDLTKPVDEALREFEWLKAALGMDHFEGRTWTGWHRHVYLGFAAYGYLASERLIPIMPACRSSLGAT